jgi:hypothetical protein
MPGGKAKMGKKSKKSGGSKKTIPSVGSPLWTTILSSTARDGGDPMSFPKPPKIDFGKIIGVPDELECNLRYHETLGNFTAAGPQTQYVLRGNSLYDPDLTGAGGQPAYYGELKALYSQYAVLGSQTTWKILNTHATIPLSAVGVYDDINTSASTYDLCAAAKYVVEKELGVLNGGNSTAELRMPYMSSAQIQGQKEIESDPNNYQGVGANPTDTWYSYIKLQSADGSSGYNFDLSFTITYRCILKELQVKS